jgi:hypothetical protein
VTAIEAVMRFCAHAESETEIRTASDKSICLIKN